jgi:hypothetical protein
MWPNSHENIYKIWNFQNKPANAKEACMEVEEFLVHGGIFQELHIRPKA